MDRRFYVIYEKICSWLMEENVNEVVFRGNKGIWAISTTGEKLPLVTPFETAEECQQWVLDLAAVSQRRLDRRHPSNGGSFFDTGYRWHAVLSPPSWDGVLLCVRKHRLDRVQIDHFDGIGTFGQFFSKIFRENQSLIICGPTSSGKTTLLAALLKAYAANDRVCILEEANEIPLLFPQWIKMCPVDATADGWGGVQMDNLFADALRLRPDRVIVGEIRYREAATFWRILLSSSVGTYTTIHAASASWVVHRISDLVGQPADKLESERRLLNVWIAELTRGARPQIKTLVDPNGVSVGVGDALNGED